MVSGLHPIFKTKHVSAELGMRSSVVRVKVLVENEDEVIIEAVYQAFSPKY
jgi:hypothetical protein